MNFLNYTFNPIVCKPSKPSKWEILKIFLVYIVIILFAAPFILFIQKKIGVQTIPIENSITFLYAVIFGPIAEEILFRLPLRFSKLNYNLLLVTISVYLIVFLTKTKIILFVLFSFYLLFAFIIRYFYKKDVSKLYSKYFKYIYWLSILSFGFIHLNNHIIVWYYMILFAPVLCFPQIVLGSITGYVRMRYGFIYSVIIHMLNNLPLYLLYQYNI